MLTTNVPSLRGSQVTCRAQSVETQAIWSHGTPTLRIISWFQIHLFDYVYDIQVMCDMGTCVEFGPT